jgi:hypothetical protein
MAGGVTILCGRRLLVQDKVPPCPAKAPIAACPKPHQAYRGPTWPPCQLLLSHFRPDNVQKPTSHTFTMSFTIKSPPLTRQMSIQNQESRIKGRARRGYTSRVQGDEYDSVIWLLPL